MAFAVSTATSSLLHSSSSRTRGKPSLSFPPNPAISIHKNEMFHHVKGISQLGFASFSQWIGLKQLNISVSHYLVKTERKGKCKGKRVFASLFGVGVPEALVIGVVALLVFGPKGLAEVARNLGKTLRSLRPTIRELQEVSREFKSSLEREIGLDEIDNSMPKSFSSYSSNTLRHMPQDTTEELGRNVEPSESAEDNESCPSVSGAYSADEYLKVTEAQLKGALARQQNEQQEEKQKTISQSESQTPQVLDVPQEASLEMPHSENPKSNTLDQEEATSAVSAPKPGNDE